MKKEIRTRELINRLARLDAAAAWEGELNPSQRAILDYLKHANKFSRSPSNIAEYLGTTRGTVSQSLKSLGLKGYVTEHRSAADKRALRFDLSDKGVEASLQRSDVVASVAKLGAEEHTALQNMLTALVEDLLAKNNGRVFGLCKNCVHFSTHGNQHHCNLLSVNLTADDAAQICHEQKPAGA